MARALGRVLVLKQPLATLPELTGIGSSKLRFWEGEEDLFCVATDEKTINFFPEYQDTLWAGNEMEMEE